MITLYHETTHAPVTLQRLMRDEVLVQRYRKPEQVGHIIIPTVAQHDRTQTLWEVLMGNERADAAVGVALPVGAIVQTARKWPTDTHLVTDAGEHAFLLSVSVCGIRGVITYAEEEA